MSETLQRLFENLRALPPARQGVLALTALGSLAFFAWVSFGMAGTEYRTLYRGVGSEEALAITQALRDERIDYRLDDGGSTVLVPAAALPEARIRVAGRGLPGSGGAGLELFDEPAFGVSDFVHRVNFVRATQGELSRSIEQLEPVERARVQVVIPERKSVLAASERKPSASVVVALRAGSQLAPGQVRSIVHLVASSIENLDPTAVTVVDTTGQLLAPVTDSQPGSIATAGGSGYQDRVESDLARRIERILEKTVGAGSVVARVSAELDWTESETTEESFDPDGQVARSEQRSTESATDAGSTGGVAGVAANLPGSATGGDESALGSSRTTETINYEITKKVSRTVRPMGRVERLSIAVLVADRPAVEPGADPVPWGPESLEMFAALARSAVGFDEKRGDEITVQTAPFLSPDVEFVPEGIPWTTWLPILSIVARGALLLVALLLFAKMVVGPVIAAVPKGPAPSLPARVDDVESELGMTAVGPGAAAMLPAHGLASQPEEGARALRNWLSEG